MGKARKPAKDKRSVPVVVESAAASAEVGASVDVVSASTVSAATMPTALQKLVGLERQSDLSPLPLSAYQEQAQAIAEQYLRELSPTHAGRFSEIADVPTVEVLLRGFTSGLKDADCARAAGLHPDTLQVWLQRGADAPESAFGALAISLQQARSFGKLRRLEKIEQHGVREWTALAWVNERTDPDQFGRRPTAGFEGGTIVVVGMPGLKAGPSPFPVIDVRSEPSTSQP